jgi:hypothetical protein
VLNLLLPIPDALFGAHPGLHLGLALVLGVATSLCIYVLLRTLSIAPVPSGAIAILALLFPWTDVLRLWSTASITTPSICFLCLGAVVAVRGLRRGGRAGVAVHAGADVLYVLSVLTYEATGAAALLAGLLYIRRAPRSVAARRWLADVVVVIGALGYSLVATSSHRHVGSLLDRFHDVPQFVRQAALLLASAVFPVGRLSAPVQALVLVAVAVIAGVALARLRRERDATVGRWIWLGGGAALTIGAAYFMFLGSNLFPLSPGIDMRSNILAGPAYCVLVFAIVATLSHLVFRSPRRASWATGAITVLIAAGYAVHLHNDESAWRRAAVQQRTVLASLDRALPRPLPRAGSLVAFERVYQTAPEVPVFDKDFDLRGALDLHEHDRTLRAYAVYAGVTVRCAPDRIVVAGQGDYGVFRVRYGAVFFLSVGRSRGRRIASAAECAQALPAFDAATGA